MKTRNGFVSNSSSQSFVIRGLLISDEELERSGCDMEDPLSWGYKHDMAIHSTRNYFVGSHEGKYVIGKETMDMEDGDVISLPPNPDDEEVRKSISALGIELGDRELQWHIQFISNDNY